MEIQNGFVHYSRSCFLFMVFQCLLLPLFRMVVRRIKDIVGKQEAVDLLQKFQYYNDNERFPLALYGFTPQEVFEGTVPDRYRFSAAIKAAEKSRYFRNKAGKFCDVCSDGK